jgi:hypothetical protein
MPAPLAASLPAAPIYAAIVAGALALVVQTLVKYWEFRSTRAAEKTVVLKDFTHAAFHLRAVRDDLEEMSAQAATLLEHAEDGTYDEEHAAALEKLQEGLPLAEARWYEGRNMAHAAGAGMLVLFDAATHSTADSYLQSLSAKESDEAKIRSDELLEEALRLAKADIASDLRLTPFRGRKKKEVAS